MRQPIDIPSRPGSHAELTRLFEQQSAKRWPLARSTAGERRERLRRLKSAVERHRVALAEGIRRDFGRAVAESEWIEIHPTLDEINAAIAHLAEWMRPEPAGTPVLLADTSSEIRFEAKGQVLILSPWNYPVFLFIGPLVGAVAAGNTAILKPSEKVPETNKVLRQIVAEAFPEDEAAVVEGEANVAEALLTLPFNHVFFTGSTRVGKLVMAAAAKTLASVTWSWVGSPRPTSRPVPTSPAPAGPSSGASSSTPGRPASLRTTSWCRRSSATPWSSRCGPAWWRATARKRAGRRTPTSPGWWTPGPLAG